MKKKTKYRIREFQANILRSFTPFARGFAFTWETRLLGSLIIKRYLTFNPVCRTMPSRPFCLPFCQILYHIKIMNKNFALTWRADEGMVSTCFTFKAPLPNEKKLNCYDSSCLFVRPYVIITNFPKCTIAIFIPTWEISISSSSKHN